MATRLCAVLFKLFFSIIAVFALFLSVANAQQLRIVIGDAEISVPGTSFSVSAAQPSVAGLFDTVRDVPIEGTLTTPTLTFDFEAPDAGGSEAIFDVGIVLDELSSSRQLEMFIPGVKLSFIPGGGVSGSLGFSLLNLYVRDQKGLSASSTVTSSGSVAFTDTTLAFSTASQVVAQQAQGGAIADIVSNISNSGLGYTYKIIFKETSEKGFVFGSSLGGFTELPTVGADAFSMLNIPTNEADSLSLEGGYVLSGVMTYANQANQDLALTLAAIDPASPGAGVDMNTALDTALALIANSTAALTEGGVGNTGQIGNLLDSLTTVSTAIRTAGNILQAGNTPDQSKILAVVISLTDSLVALGDTFSGTTTGLSATQVEELNQLSVDTIYGLADTLVESTSVEDNDRTQQVVDDLIPATIAVDPNFTLELFGAAKSVIAKRVPEYVIDSPECQAGEAMSRLGNCVPNSVAEKAQLDSARSGSLAITEVVATTLSPGIIAGGIVAGKLFSIILELSTSGDSETPDQVINNVLGTEGSVVGASQVAFTSETSAVIQLTPSVQANLASLSRKIGQPATESIADSQERIQTGASIYAYIRDIVVLPDSVADGSAYLSNGNILLAQNGIGITLVPAPADEAAFVEGLDALGGTAVLNSDYSLSISAGGANISASFGFEEIADSANSVPGAAGFELKGSGDESNVSYVLTVEYADGRIQSLQPYVAEQGFIASIREIGFSVTVNRATGVISIDGVGDFRPSYLVTPGDAADVSLLASSGDAHGIAYRVLDANSDGITDIKVVSAAGVQLIYGL